MPTRLAVLPERLKRARIAFTFRLKLLVGECELCRFRKVWGPRILHAHEALVTGSDLGGVRDVRVWELMLLSPANVVCLDPVCHLNKRPSRETCLELVLMRSDSIYEQFGYRNARDSVTIFYVNLILLFRDGILKVRPTLPANLPDWLSATLEEL